jgi:hypothetical protein
MSQINQSDSYLPNETSRIITEQSLSANEGVSIRGLVEKSTAKHKRITRSLLLCLPVVIIWAMGSGALDLALYEISHAWLFDQ